MGLATQESVLSQFDTSTADKMANYQRLMALFVTEADIADMKAKRGILVAPLHLNGATNSELSVDINILTGLIDKIKLSELKETVSRIVSLLRTIDKEVYENPDKQGLLGGLSNFDYAVKQTIKFAESYIKFQSITNLPPDAQTMQDRLPVEIAKLEGFFQNMLNKLYQYDVSDLQSDMKVMESMFGSERNAFNQ